MSLLVAVICASSGCGPVVEAESDDSASSEPAPVPARSDCYEWDVEVLRGGAGAGVGSIAISGSDLFLGQVEGVPDVQRAAGRGGPLEPLGAADAFEDALLLSDMAPHPDGGVVTLWFARTTETLGLVLADPDGDAELLSQPDSRIDAPKEAAIVTHGSGYAIASLERPTDSTLEARVLVLDEAGNERWRQSTPLEWAWWSAGPEFALSALPGDAGFVLVVEDVTLADTAEGTGIRRLQFDSEGTLVGTAELAVSTEVLDFEFRNGVELSVVLRGTLLLQLGAELETLWSIESDEHEIFYGATWNPHTDRMLLDAGSRVPGGRLLNAYLVVDGEGATEWSHVAGPETYWLGDAAPDPLGGFILSEGMEFRIHQLVPRACQ